MVEHESAHKCEVCGAGGTLVEFGDPHAYRYHCLSCWWEVAERVVVEYAEREPAPPGARTAGG